MTNTGWANTGAEAGEGGDMLGSPGNFREMEKPRKVKIFVDVGVAGVCETVSVTNIGFQAFSAYAAYKFMSLIAVP